MLVVDASVTMEWFLPGQKTAYGARAFERAQKSLIVIPALWLWETQNVILTCLRQKVLTPQRASEIRLELSMISKRVDGPPDEWVVDRIWEVATQHVSTYYDASYVELALRLGLPLASTDRGVRHAATGAGVELI